MANQSSDADFKAGERRIATILFSDMKDFTALSESMDPEEMDSLMNTVFSGFEAIVRRHDGFVEKYIGDALVAVFGAHRIHEDDPIRAVNTALDFIDEMKKVNRSQSARPRPISFRTGIHTGLIATGKRGRFEVVTGHAMSVASRLEGAAPPNSIYISRGTKERCRSEFRFSEPIELELRGREEPVIAYQVLGRNTHPLHDFSVFVGREQELSQMTRAYLKHDPSKTDGFSIIGEAGVGKTSLVSRFIDRIRRFPDFSSPILYARAQRYRTLPFAVVTDLISNLLGLDSRTDEDAIIGTLRDTLAVEEKSARAFAGLLTGSQSGSLDAQFFVHLYVILQSILAGSQKSPYPALVFIDNAEQMDVQSRDFFQFFLKNSTSRPFFFFSDRNEPQTLSELFRGVRTIPLLPLSKEESNDLLHELWPECPDTELAQTILGNAAGNPLFLREYIRYARDAKDLTAIPSTIQTIFLASIDTFEPAIADLLKKLSVFAHSFSVEDAAYIQERTDADPTIVRDAIGLFLHQGIIIHENAIYLFKHDLFKKALYDTLLNYNKKIVHRLIANRMREVGNPHNLRLMYHLTRAGDVEDAHTVLMAAPDRTVNMEYLPYIDTLLTHTGEQDNDARIQYLFMKSEILFNNGNTEEADAIMKQILRIAVQQKNFQYMANAYHLLTAYNMKSYGFQKAYFCGRKAVSYYERMGTRQTSEANVIKIMSLTELLRNNVAESSRLVERLSGKPFAHYIDAIEARAERYLLTGEYRQAADLLEYSLGKLGESRDDHWFAVHSLLSLAYWQLCDFEKIKSTARRLLSAGGRHYSNISQLHANLAVACHFTDEPERVAENIQQAEFYAYQIRNDFDLIDALRSLAVALLTLGDTEKAAALAQEGLTIGLRHSAFYPAFSLLMVLAEIHYNRGETENCRFFLEEAAFSIELNPLLPTRDIMLYHYLRYLTEPGEKRMDYLETAYGLFEHEKAELGNPGLVSNFLAMRCFSKIQKDIAVAHGNSSSEGGAR